MASGVMANSSGNPEMKYQDKDSINSITFYQDGTFYIERSGRHNIAGTYWKPESLRYYLYQIRIETLDKKTANGIMMPNGQNQGMV